MNATKNIHCQLEVFEQSKDLSQEEQLLLDKALKATDLAYAPYSEFYVGAALELEDGTVIVGCNQENAAYPSGLCAERVAFFAAGAQHPGKKIKKLAIRIRSEKHKADQPGVPCGACLQVMREVEKRQQTSIDVFLQGSGNQIWKAAGLHNFLPFSFDL
jgi:cytidine deaminase